MLAWLGSLAGSVIGGVGAVAGGAATAVGTAGGAVVSGAGSVISGAGQVIGGAASGLGQAAGGIVQTVGSAIKGLPMSIEKYKPITDVIGGAYGIYSSYEQKKQADKIKENYGRQTTAPVFIAPSSPGISEGFRTIVDVQLPPEQQEMYEAYALQKHDTERLVKYGLVAVVAYVILTRL